MNPGQYGLYSDYQPGRCFLDLIMVMGASGAVPTPFNKSTIGQGFQSCVRASAGTYTAVLLGRPANMLKMDGSCVQTGAYSTAGICDVRVTSYVPATRTITFVTVNGAGTATDAAAGDTVRLNLQAQLFQC